MSTPALPDNPKLGMNWLGRFKAAGIHACISLAIAALAALLVFAVWYPYPYREISSGRELFLLVVSVDVVLGPLITLAIFNLKKPRAELVRDFAVIGCIQLAALLYGLWTVFVARPVHLVFEYDRFRVVHAIDVPAELDKDLGAHRYPIGKPTTLGLREFKTPNEEMELTMAAIGGLHLSVQPKLWQPYALSDKRVRAAAKPLSDLQRRFPNEQAQIAQAVKDSGAKPEDLNYLPMIGRKTFWTVLIDRQSLQPLAYLPLDSF